MANNKVTKDILVGELVSKHPETIETLVSNGMHCLGCPSSQAESLQDACFVHGLDADKVLDAVNDAIEAHAAEASEGARFWGLYTSGCIIKYVFRRA